MLFDGIHIPLTVPFTRDGEMYLRKLEYNVGRYSLGPAAGLVALTSECEGAALSDEEIGEALQVIGASAAPEKVLVAAIAKDSVRGALAIARQAEAAGFDAVLVDAPPQWARLNNEKDVLLFFRAVADASPLPVLLGSEMDALGFPISVEMIGVLARHPNVYGMYDDELTVERYQAIARTTREVKREVAVTTVFAPVTGRMLRRGQPEGGLVSAEALVGGAAVAAEAKALKTRTKTVGFQVMSSGSARGLVELLAAGVPGAMPALSACAPQGCYEAFAAFKDGDPALAAEKGERLLEADAAILGLGISAVKYGCDWNGFYGGSPRLPRLPLNAEGRAVVERVLAGMRN